MKHGVRCHHLYLRNNFKHFIAEITINKDFSELYISSLVRSGKTLKIEENWSNHTTISLAGFKDIREKLTREIMVRNYFRKKMKLRKHHFGDLLVVGNRPYIHSRDKKEEVDI
jgi:hypothetical protein